MWCILMSIPEFRVGRVKPSHYIILAVVLTVSALILTYVGMELKNVWLMIIALSLVLVSFGVMTLGIYVKVLEKLTSGRVAS